MPWEDLAPADALVVAVAHRQFLDRPIEAYLQKLTANGCFVDVKSRFDADALRAAGVAVWRL